MPTTNGFVAVVRTIHEIRNDYKISFFPDMKLYQTFYHIAALALFGSAIAAPLNLVKDEEAETISVFRSGSRSR